MIPIGANIENNDHMRMYDSSNSKEPTESKNSVLAEALSWAWVLGITGLYLMQFGDLFDPIMSILSNVK